MFSWLTKLKPGGSDINSDEPAASEHRDSDREEDGFLLVGETVGEKTPVLDQERNLHQPPSHLQVTMSNPASLSGSATSNQHDPTSRNFFSERNISHISPLSDVPFKFSSDLEIIAKFLDFRLDFIPIRNICQDYNYDFSFENSLLRDLDYSHNGLIKKGPEPAADLITF